MSTQSAPTLAFSSDALMSKRRPLKRLFDILFSASVIAIAIPLYAAIALSIKLTSKGPIFYASKRLGKSGKFILCWKFRTMCIDADLKLQDVISKNPALHEEWEKYRKLKTDPRVTRIGRFLRKTSLDEFPQFWNVLKGDLSIVGPRPAFAEEIERHAGEKAGKILSIRPGLTGIWQTSGRNLLTFDERVALEASYVDRQSFLFDLKLIGKTVPLMLFPKDAY